LPGRDGGIGHPPSGGIEQRNVSLFTYTVYLDYNYNDVLSRFKALRCIEDLSPHSFLILPLIRPPQAVSAVRLWPWT
jgi:hypothetical protein